MNKTMLSGRLTKDVKVTEKGDQKIVTFNLAVDRRRGRTEDGTSNADFPRCVAFGRAAEYASQYKQGDLVAVTGHIQTSSYDGKNGRVYNTDVIVDETEMLRKRNVEPTVQPSQSFGVNPMQTSFEIDDEDELPFN